MHRSGMILVVLATAVLAAPGALACGEGIFQSGDGLRYQGYLAPRPATVLVYDDERAPPAQRIAVYRGMVQAGHRLTVAHSPDELSQAMRLRRYDVVIAGLEAVDLVASATGRGATAPRLLPVVDRQARNSPGLRSRFAQFVLDGASLGQYLKQINRLMGG